MFEAFNFHKRGTSPIFLIPNEKVPLRPTTFKIHLITNYYQVENKKRYFLQLFLA